MKDGRSPFLFDDEAAPDEGDISDFSVRESLSRSNSLLEAEREKGWEELQALADEMARDNDPTLTLDGPDDDVVKSPCNVDILKYFLIGNASRPVSLPRLLPPRT